MPEQWLVERKMMNRWAFWCCRDDGSTLMRLCGLTWAGSPPAIMAALWERGAETEDDVTGYASEARSMPDDQSAEVDLFMNALRSILPAAHSALMARHRRMIHGELVLTRSEGWLARALYGKSRARSHAMLVKDCEAGYSALRRWFAAKQAAA